VGEHCTFLCCLLLMPPPPSFTLFPYTTLFRSAVVGDWSGSSCAVTTTPRNTAITASTMFHCRDRRYFASRVAAVLLIGGPAPCSELSGITILHSRLCEIVDDRCQAVKETSHYRK